MAWPITVAATTQATAKEWLKHTDPAGEEDAREEWTGLALEEGRIQPGVVHLVTEENTYKDQTLNVMSRPAMQEELDFIGIKKRVTE